MTDRLSKLRRLDLSRFGMLIALLLLAVTLVAIVAGIRSVGSLRSIGDTADTVQPKAMQGVLDLRGYRMAASRAVELNGEWSWYGSLFLEPGSEAAAPADGFVPVPSEWRNVRLNGGPLPSQGYGTYRLHVLLPESLQQQVLGLYIPSVASAYRLWVNGMPLASNGMVGTSVETMVPKNYPKVVYLHPDGAATLDILIQVSNYVQRKGGLWQPIKLGLVDPIMHERNGNMFYEVFIVGSLLMMSLYHVGLFLTRKRNGSALFFAIVCTSIAVRTLFLGETLAVYFIPELDWEWGVKAEYISAELALWGLLYFLHAQYPQESSRIVRLAVTAVVVYCIVNQLLSPARAYTELFFYFQYGFVLPVVFYMLVVYVLAACRRRPGSIINLIGLLAIGAAVVHDTLSYTRLHTGVDLVPLGFLAFLLTQSVQLSMSFSRAFTRVEKLSHELSELNDSLGTKIVERTKDLQQANESLQLKEEFRRRLLSNISHELMTPLTSLKLYINAVIDRVVPSDEPRIWLLLKEKAQFLEHMIIDLFELTKLETRQIQFRFAVTELLPFLHDVGARQELDLRAKGIELEVRPVHEPAVERAAHAMKVRIDPVRMEQVFTNLLSNAKRFTPSGGRIDIRVICSHDGASALIEVADTGSGIPEEELDNVFERYYRGSNLVKNKDNGSGLGLAICKEIISCHDGTIDVRSSSGEGTVFTIILPLVQTENEE